MADHRDAGRHHAEEAQVVDGVLAVRNHVDGVVELFHGGAAGAVHHDSEHVAIEAEHGRSFGDEALGGLGEHSEHGVSESVAVQQVDARKVIEPQQHDAALRFAGDEPIDEVRAFVVREQPGDRVDFTLALQTGDHAGEHRRLAVLVALQKSATHHPDTFSQGVLHLVFEIVAVGFP